MNSRSQGGGRWLSSWRDARYEAVVVGGGAAGLQAAVTLARSGRSTALLSKMPPRRAATASAQYGISAAIEAGDSPALHAAETRESGEALADPEATRVMTDAGPGLAAQLTDLGMPFSRAPDGSLALKGVGRAGRPSRTLYAADRTGTALIDALTQAAAQAGCAFFYHTFALDLIMEDGECKGVTGLGLADGSLQRFLAASTILATGGFTRAYGTATASLACTGDGIGMAARAGLPCADMELVQFHPTGIAGVGCLVGGRGEGAFLTNEAGDRFMKSYSAKEDLASKNAIASAIETEIAEGRGCGPSHDCVNLQLGHIEDLDSRLGSLVRSARLFAGVDVTKDGLPVRPAAHYAIGGIATNERGAVVDIKDGQRVPVPRLFAVGECAGSGANGATRSGSNGLLEALAFGQAAAATAAEYTDIPQLRNSEAGGASLARLDRFLSAKGKEANPTISDLRDRLGTLMQSKVGVRRSEDGLREALVQLVKLQSALAQVRINLKVSDEELAWNGELVEALELQNLLTAALQTTKAALDRKETRGAHMRHDFPKPDHDHWDKRIFTLMRPDEMDGVRTVPLPV